MQCEGGDLLPVAGHLDLMSMPDPLFRALGMPDSSGEVGAALGGVSEDQRSALERLADPMRMMKLFGRFPNRFQRRGGQVHDFLESLQQR